MLCPVGDYLCVVPNFTQAVVQLTSAIVKIYLRVVGVDSELGVHERRKVNYKYEKWKGAKDAALGDFSERV